MSPGLRFMSVRLHRQLAGYGADMDGLSDAVAAMRTGRPHSSRRDRYTPWGMRFEASDGAGFHVVLRGSAWLFPADGEPVAVGPGDAVFLAHGRGHALAGGVDVPLEEVRLRADGTWPQPPSPELGTRAGLSRAAFARRFATLVGEPPLTYLTWWRMITAGRLLREDDTPLRLVAQRTGYTPEFAFAKAFKREYGMAPGQYRKRAS